MEQAAGIVRKRTRKVLNETVDFFHVLCQVSKIASQSLEYLLTLSAGLRPILLYCIGIAIQRIVGGIASRQQYEIRCESIVLTKISHELLQHVLLRVAVARR